eukprot:2611961-Rhodomonas_salina.2
MTSMTCVCTERELAKSFPATAVETCSGCPEMCVFGCKHECSAVWVIGLEQRVGMGMRGLRAAAASVGQ